MNKMKKYLMMLATLFSAVVGFTACSSEDDLASSEQEERGVVKTEFTISFPQTTTGRTRQSADVVQAAAASNLTKFRGIKGIILYPFSVDASGVSGTTDVPAAITLYGGTTVGKAGASGTDPNTIAGYDATTYTEATGLGSLYKASSAHLYKNVDIAIGTKSFIFYGEAATTNTQAAQQVGSLTKTVEAGDKTLNGITYSPTPIFTDDAVGSNGNTIAAYLTSIAQAKTEANDKWLESATAGNVGLATLYDNFTKITAGSWTNVKAIVQRMYTNLAPKTEDTDKTVAMKNAIRTAIVNKTTYGVHDDDGDGVLNFTEDYDNFPADLGLPDGAAQLTCNATTGVFSYIVTKEENTGMNVTPLAHFAYPASLYYFVKSGIKTSEVAKESYSDTETWTTITDAYTDGTSVTSKTRSIVIKDKVQYAVGRLDVTVKSSGTSLQDGNSQSINTMSGANPLFPVTGILVGMQKPVGWNFEQKGGTSYTVYDNQVDDGAPRYLTTTESTAIHTLLLETNDATSGTDTNADVNIAVEFLNNSDKTIVGYNGQLILPKTKFYLLGTLHPWKGESPDIKRAFKQDYITTANLTVTSLANAHNTLPDLTVPSLSLGLSIDMEWKTGVTYDINIQ